MMITSTLLPIFASWLPLLLFPLLPSFLLSQYGTKQVLPCRRRAFAQVRDHGRAFATDGVGPLFLGGKHLGDDLVDIAHVLRLRSVRSVGASSSPHFLYS